jgi:hypothetical protein
MPVSLLTRYEVEAGQLFKAQRENRHKLFSGAAYVESQAQFGSSNCSKLVFHMEENTPQPFDTPRATPAPCTLRLTVH